MTTYVRTHNGHTMTVHAPARGTFDADQAAAFTAFTTANDLMGLDVETSAIEDHTPAQFADDFTVRLVQLGSETEAWVLDPRDPDQRAALQHTLADPRTRYVTHTNYDPLAVWTTLGVALGQRCVDTHLISKLIDPDEHAGHGLKDLTARHLDDGLVQAETALHARMRALAPSGHRSGKSWLTWGWNHMPADDETYVVYAGLDAIYARRLLPVLLNQCAPMAHLVRMEQWLAAQATGITIRGQLLDRDYTTALLADLETEHDTAAARIQAALGFSGASPRFATWLENTLTRALDAIDASTVDLPRTDTGRLSVAADALATVLRDHGDLLTAEQRDLVHARQTMADHSNNIANLRSFLSYADSADRVHPQINTLRAKTARMSATRPGLQTLKKHDPRLRHCLRADPGHVLVRCDFAQVEIRVAAALARDPALIAAVETGDLHNAMAALMYGQGFTDEQRTISKRATFGSLYGGGARALSQQTGVTYETADQVINRWKSTYPRVVAYTNALATQREVVTASGRRIPGNPERAYANGNYAIQSSARDLLLACVYDLVTRLGITDLWLFVHDEVIVQAPSDQAEDVRAALQDAMTTTFRGVPITAEADVLGTHWGHLKDTADPDSGTESSGLAA